MRKHDAVVVGGNGAVGSLLCQALAHDGYSVLATDVSERTSPSSPEGVEHEVADILNPSARLIQAVADARLVVLAVPEHIALGTDLSLFDRVALVVETLSVKSAFAAAVEASGRAHAVLGINPMFAPALGFGGRPVACVRHRSGVAAEDFVARITAWGGRVVDVDSDMHDRAAAATQALTHASVLAFGSALGSLGLDPSLVDAIAPPPARTSLALLARIAGGEPEVYWDVQAGNPYAHQARMALVEAASRLDAAVGSGTGEEFGALVERAGAAVPDGESYRRLCADLFGIVRDQGPEGNR
ncbi:MAG: prephenate dehydrogenase dimerization domain-containing protein [Rhodococcus sp. (in: high G+C Gram-positive bacteria)]